MKSTELKNILERIDHKGYPAYKDTKGKYEFQGYMLSIDHVQGDPFASPSKVSIHISGEQAGFPKHLWKEKEKRIALQDYLLRTFGKSVEKVSFKAKGSGKSGLMTVSRPGQEILERSGCTIDEASGSLVLRMEIGFPANGRTVNSRELEKILFQFLPECVKTTLYYQVLPKEEVEAVANLAEDQKYIREQLKEKGLIAFVGNGAILPRESGVSGRPMKGAVSFVSPKSMEVTMNLPHFGTLKGMGIKKGINLIVGGGYHGKSTLLKALEAGVYNHIAGDGREYVITEDTAMKIRAEDGRSIKSVDISMFIRDLPNGKDTVSFETEDASGSTSQAANMIESMEAGTKVFLIDEDTSATNFMIRDDLMQRVVQREAEPIIPFIDRVEELYQTFGISTILVAGSSGSYFHKADCVIQMNRYEPMDITEFAKEQASHFPLSVKEVTPLPELKFQRKIKPDGKLKGEQRIKLKTMGRDSICLNHETVDVRYVEQLMDSEQLIMLGHLLKYAQTKVFDGKKTLQEVVEILVQMINHQELEKICGGGCLPCNLAMPRKQEIFACINRYRKLKF